MSKGLGKTQRVIHDLLSGARSGQVYSSCSNGLDTKELLEELAEAEFISEGMPRKQQMATVVRACRGLVQRGLVSGKYVPDGDNAGRTTVHWKIARPESE